MALRGRSDLSGRIPLIQAPALLLWGDADPISPVGIASPCGAYSPKADMAIVKGGDHMLARDRAEDITPHIARHLVPDRP